MAIDYSRLSDEELEAIARDDYSSLSEATLRMLAGETEQAPEAAAAPPPETQAITAKEEPKKERRGFFDRPVMMRPDEYGERFYTEPEVGPSLREVGKAGVSAGLGVIGGFPRMGAGITSIAGETEASQALREMEQRLREQAPVKEAFDVAKYAPEIIPAAATAKVISKIPMASRAAQQVSQAAGQAGVAATVEPEDRAEAAALAGGLGLLPLTQRGVGMLREKFNEIMTGGPPDIVRDQFARIAEQLGFKIEAGQVSRGSPVSTAGAGDAAISNQEKANRWASAPTGESTDKVTGTFINERRNALGNVYNDIFQNRQFNVSGDSIRTLESVLELENSISPAHVPSVKKLAEQILKNYDELVTNVQRTGATTLSQPGGRQSYFFTIDGEGLQRLRNKLTTVASTATDKAAARQIYNMIDNLDNVVRDTDPKLYEKLIDTNQKYRATMTLRELQDKKGIDAGDVSLERLGNLVRGDDFNPLFPIGNIGEQLGIRAIWEPTVAGAARGVTQQASTLMRPGITRIIFNRLARYPSSQAARNLQKKIIDAEATGGLGNISFSAEEIAILNPILRSIAEESPEPQEKARGGPVHYSPQEEMLLRKYARGGPASNPTVPSEEPEGEEKGRVARFLEAAVQELPSAMLENVQGYSDLASKYLTWKFGGMPVEDQVAFARSLPSALREAAVNAIQSAKELPEKIRTATPESAGEFTGRILAGELTDPMRVGRAARAVTKPVMSQMGDVIDFRRRGKVIDAKSTKAGANLPNLEADLAKKGYTLKPGFKEGEIDIYGPSLGRDPSIPQKLETVSQGGKPEAIQRAKNIQALEEAQSKSSINRNPFEAYKDFGNLDSYIADRPDLLEKMTGKKQRVLKPEISAIEPSFKNKNFKVKFKNGDQFVVNDIEPKTIEELKQQVIKDDLYDQVPASLQGKTVKELIEEMAFQGKSEEQIRDILTGKKRLNLKNKDISDSNLNKNKNVDFDNAKKQKSIDELSEKLTQTIGEQVQMRPETANVSSIKVKIPIEEIEHGESVTPGGKMTWPGARDLIKEYASRKTPLPPIEVVSNEVGMGTPWMVVDGSHRLEAARLRGQKTIDALISPYDEEGLALAKKLKEKQK